MAYINKETAKKIRNALKAEFGKNVKFSVRVKDHMSLYVDIMESEFFEDGEYKQINTYSIKNSFKKPQADFLIKIKEIIEKEGEYYNKSDSMTDYFDYAFFYHITVGKWNKKHIKKV